MVSGCGTWRGGEELGEVFDLVGVGAGDNKVGAQGWDGVDWSFNDGQGKVLNEDVSEGDTDNGVFKLSMGIFILVLGGPLKDWAVEGF